MGIESIEVGEGLDHLDRVIEDNCSAGAEARATRSDTVGIERNVFHRPIELGAVGELAFETFADLEDFGGGAARDNCFKFPSVERTAAEIIEQFAEGGLTGFDFV